jgi:Bacteriophage T4-like portal protein (Gp20)
MAQDGFKLRNIFTALGRVFSNSKPNEFIARNSIERALSVTQRELAARPAVEPTVIAKKGLGRGSIFNEEGLGANYHKYLERETLRHARYTMYDRMDADLIASAIDVYANEATQKNQDGKVVGIHSTSRYIQDQLEEMLENTGINNYMSWSILRNMVKYGDHFTALTLDSVAGVTRLTELDAISVYRLEEKGDLIGYVQDIDVLKSAVQNANVSSTTTNPYNNLNTLSLPYLTGDSVDKENEDTLITFLKYEMLHFKVRGSGLFAPYGTSPLDTAVDTWKKLDLMFDSLVIYRLNRAPTRLVFYVDVGNAQGADAENIVKKQINALAKKEYFDPTGKLNERYQLLDMNANLYIPLQKGGTSKVEKLEGVTNVGDIEDVAFLNNRLFAALKVPKSFLGYEGDVSSKGMLSQQNVTFSKAIQNLQEDFLETIKDLCLIHLAIKGISEKTELKSFSLVMTRPSYIEEKNRIENDGALLDLAGKYTSMGINRRWVAKHVMHKSEAEIEEMFEIDPTAPQAGAEGAGGMSGGMGMSDMGNLGTGALPTEPMPQQAEMQPAGPEQAIPGAELGGQMPATGNTPLMQSNRYYIGSLLVETFDTICDASRITSKVAKLQESIKDGGFATKNEVRVTRVLVEQKKSKLTEPEEIFEQ